MLPTRPRAHEPPHGRFVSLPVQFALGWGMGGRIPGAAAGRQRLEFRMRVPRDQFHRHSFAVLWATWKLLVYNYGRGLVGKKRHPMRPYLEAIESRLRHHAGSISEYLRDELRTVTPFTHSDIPLDYFDSHLVYNTNEVDVLCTQCGIALDSGSANGTLVGEDAKAFSAATRAGERHAKKLLLDGKGLLKKKHVRVVEPPLLQKAGESPLAWPTEPIVGWDHLTPQDLTRLEAAVTHARSESDMQKFLDANPEFLTQHLRGGHGRWVISQQKLGCQYVTDFILGERSSIGMEWHPLELESPTAKLFTRAGDATATLNHAIRQILDWRRWLSDNLDYARRPLDQNGLGLVDVHPNSPAMIMMGRSASLNTGLNRRRQDMIYEFGSRFEPMTRWLTPRAVA